MRTSRISRETAKIVSKTSHGISRRQTRSIGTSLQRSTVTENTSQETNNSKIKQEDDGNDNDDSSSLSSLASTTSHDIEDFPSPVSHTRKRKRSLKPITDITTSNISRFSPRKPYIKDEDGPAANTKKARRQPAKQVVNGAGEVEVHPPANWEKIYEAVREMRKHVLAPVDTMGCETLAEDNRSPRDKRFQTLIALMLSSQTKDTTNAIAMRRLQEELPSPGLTLENILEVDPERLNEMIYVVGFHNNKTRYIKAAALILRDNFASDIPDTIEGLMSLPGVGPKMAYLCLSAAWGRTEGIGVDVHVHRITNLWGWHKTKGPEETRITLEAWLPREKWHEINHLLVGFGQTICLPVGRNCGDCTLSAKGLCPSAVLPRTKVTKRVKKEAVIEETYPNKHIVIKDESTKIKKEGTINSSEA